MFAFLGRLVCRHFHHRISRPYWGEYACWTCGRRWPVPWTTTARAVAERKPPCSELAAAIKSEPAQLALIYGGREARES